MKLIFQSGKLLINTKRKSLIRIAFYAAYESIFKFKKRNLRLQYFLLFFKFCRSKNIVIITFYFYLKRA